MNQAEAIIKALEARGEKEVTRGGASKFRKFTRLFQAERTADGKLMPAGFSRTFWFVSRNGSLRIGTTSASTRLVGKERKGILIKEGREPQLFEGSKS